MDPRPFDVVFCDTCIGASTVLSALARDRTGLRAFFLADYAVNPLGTRSHAGITAALRRWLDHCLGRADTLVVACNTASVRLQECPEVLAEALEQGVRVVSMLDLLDRVVEERREGVHGKNVCLMGTEFTVGRPLYSRRLLDAGARRVIPLPATRTERRVAHLDFRSEAGRADIRGEVAGAVSEADSVVLACTCFPLVGDVLRDVKRDLRFIDPAEGISGILGFEGGNGPNRLSVAVTGGVVSPDEVRAETHRLFPGWELERVESTEKGGSLERLDSDPAHA